MGHSLRLVRSRVGLEQERLLRAKVGLAPLLLFLRMLGVVYGCSRMLNGVTDAEKNSLPQGRV